MFWNKREKKKHTKLKEANGLCYVVARSSGITDTRSKEKKQQLTKNDLLVSSRYTYEVWLMAAKDLKNLQDKQTEVRARC